MKRIFAHTRRAAGHELLHRSALFSISVGISTIVGVFSIPILNAHIGKEGFATLALAQAIMQFLVVLMAFGWGATGPSLVSAMPHNERKSYFLSSVKARSVLTAIGMPTAVATLFALTPMSPAEVVMAAIAYSMPAIGAAWYFVGTNRPVALLLFDGLPPLLGQIAGLSTLFFAPKLTAYLLCVLVANVVGVLVSWWYVASREEDGPLRSSTEVPIMSMLREQLPGVLAMGTSSLSAALPIVLVSQFAPSALPQFAVADKLYKYAIIVLAPILQAIQGWVPEAGRATMPHRARAATWVGVAIGISGGIGLAVLTPLIAPVISYGNIAIPFTLSAIVGLAFVGEATAQISGLSSLVALGEGRALARSSMVATVFGMFTLLALVGAWGVYGAVTAIAATALGLAVYRMITVRRVAGRMTAG